VGAITAAVLEAEGGARRRDPSRVFVFPLEIPEGAWGAAGRINRLEDIIGWVTDDAAGARRYAEERLALC